MTLTIDIPFNDTTMLIERFFADQTVKSFFLRKNSEAKQLLADKLGHPERASHVHFVPSCTAALEMAALLLDCSPGDEIIMPSNTFVSTANAFVLRGATPVFVDCMPGTLNVGPRNIEKAITRKTKAIVPVHYAGVACEMESLVELAKAYDLAVVEDAAQCIGAYYKGCHLGTLGDFGTLSFHYTKNLTSGEGGALFVKEDELSTKAEILREKGTNRSLFLRGEVNKYTWQNIGSSYVLGDLAINSLLPQMKALEEITADRLRVWDAYHSALAHLEAKELLRRPVVPKECQHNAHIYFVILNKKFNRAHVINQIAMKGVQVFSHYVPLHNSPAGRKFGRFSDKMVVTNNIASSLIRLPLYYGLEDANIQRVVGGLHEVLSS